MTWNNMSLYFLAFDVFIWWKWTERRKLWVFGFYGAGSADDDYLSLFFFWCCFPLKCGSTEWMQSMVFHYCVKNCTFLRVKLIWIPRKIIIVFNIMITITSMTTVNERFILMLPSISNGIQADGWVREREVGRLGRRRLGMMNIELSILMCNRILKLTCRRLKA